MVVAMDEIGGQLDLDSLNLSDASSESLRENENASMSLQENQNASMPWWEKVSASMPCSVKASARRVNLDCTDIFSIQSAARIVASAPSELFYDAKVKRFFVSGVRLVLLDSFKTFVQNFLPPSASRPTSTEVSVEKMRCEKSASQQEAQEILFQLKLLNIELLSGAELLLKLSSGTATLAHVPGTLECATWSLHLDAVSVVRVEGTKSRESTLFTPPTLPLDRFSSRNHARDVY